MEVAYSASRDISECVICELFMILNSVRIIIKMFHRPSEMTLRCDKLQLSHVTINFPNFLLLYAFASPPPPLYEVPILPFTGIL
jgi:hypothetical protein